MLRVFLLTVVAIVCIAACAVIAASDPKAKPVLFHLYNADGCVLDEIILPTGFEELAADEKARQWFPIARIEKPDYCKLPGEVVIIATFSVDGVTEISMLVYSCDNPYSMKIISLVAVRSPTQHAFYWYGNSREGKLVNQDEFTKCFEQFMGKDKTAL